MSDTQHSSFGLPGSNGQLAGGDAPGAAAHADASCAGVRVRVIGVGGAGANAVDSYLPDSRLTVSRCVVNTDAQALAEVRTAEKVLVGRSLTRGLSAGGDPEVGRKVAQKDRPQLEALVAGQDLVFIVAGLGGGTGSAIAAALAQMATAHGAVVVGFAALPFAMEGQKRQEIARTAQGELRLNCDALLSLPNDLLMQHMAEDATVVDAFAQANAWIARAIESVVTMIVRTGTINLDLAALKAAIGGGGRTLFGLGRGKGADCVEEALNDLLLCPLLNRPEHTGRSERLLLNIVGGKDLSLGAINRILGTVADHFGSREHTVLGAVIDESLSQTVELCVIGTSGGSGLRRRPDVVPGRLVSHLADAPATAHPIADEGISANAAHAFPVDSGVAGSEPSATASEFDPAARQGADTPAQGDGATPGAAGQPTDVNEQPRNPFARDGDAAFAGSNGSGAFSQSMIPGTCEEANAEGHSLFSRDMELPAGQSASARRVHDSKLKQRKKQQDQQRTDTDGQEEFLFVAAGEQRGVFEKTERNLFDGEDLDVPTYLRRNIRIVL